MPSVQEVHRSWKMNGSGCVFDHYGRIPEGIYKGTNFTSPLEEAVYNNDVDTFRSLVKEGHPVSVRLRVGEMSCIEFAAMMGYADMLAAIIDNSPNAGTLRKYFALEDVVERAYMISRNKDIFFSQEALAEANRYEAALFTAVEYDRPESVRVMLGYIGRKDPPRHCFTVADNRKNLSAAELAKIRGYTKCQELLENQLRACVKV